MRTPTSTTMFDAVSVREWKPSDRTLTAPDDRPRAILAAAMRHTVFYSAQSLLALPPESHLAQKSFPNFLAADFSVHL